MHKLTDCVCDLAEMPFERLKQIESRGQEVLSLMKGLLSLDILPRSSYQRHGQDRAHIVGTNTKMGLGMMVVYRKSVKDHKLVDLSALRTGTQDQHIS
ncbi:MAG: hypothetical protein ABSE46_23490 [Terracidiphilus sp.]|jgi:hypothetical protein